jgi:prepilin-type N-terminal cleavage/methylation domain-containing protein
MRLQAWKRPSRRGFTLIEVLVVLALMGIILLIGLPSLFNYIRRSKVEGSLQGISSLIRLARLEAIKQGVPVVVRADYAQDTVTAFVDRNSNLAFDPTAGANPRATDREIGRVPLANGVFFWGLRDPSGPADATREGSNAVSGFTADPGSSTLPGLAVFDPNGTIRNLGRFEISDGRGNFVEVRVEPQSTARVSLWKWNRADSVYYERGNQAPVSGGGAASGKTTWEWY